MNSNVSALDIQVVYIGGRDYKRAPVIQPNARY